jgi:hypothetical protein
VWLPGRKKASDSANATFDYRVDGSNPPVVTTNELKSNGSYDVSYAIYDGLLRERQAQSAAPGPDGGRIIHETVYDSRGLPADVNTLYATGSAASTIFATNPAQVNTQSHSEFDGAGRANKQTLRVLNVDKWHTSTIYGGDRTTVVPPTSYRLQPRRQREVAGPAECAGPSGRDADHDLRRSGQSPADGGQRLVR